MLVNRRGKSILSIRWGRKRSPSSIVRISSKSRKILDRIPDKHRRVFLDRLILNASKTESYRALTT